MFIKCVFNFYLLFALLNVPFSWGEIGCRGYFSSGHLIINFTKSVLGESLSRNWENQILQSFSNWSHKDLESFLNDLSQRISKEDIVKGLKEPAFFDQSSYEQFQKTLKLYENYIGAEGVTEKLKVSLGDFFYSHSFNEIKPIPGLLEFYLGGKEKVKDLMQKDLRAFT